MALVGGSSLAAGDGEGLAGAGSGPDGAIVGPSSKAQGVAPDASSGEEVALPVSHKVAWRNVRDAPLIDIPRRDDARAYQLAQRGRGLRVDFVVVGGQG